MLFLDANAHLPMHKSAVDAFIKFNSTLAAHGHASSGSGIGRLAAIEIDTCRKKIAQMIGAKSNQIIFTSTCSQACEWGLEIFHKYNFDKVYTSVLEHKSVAEKSRLLFGNNDLISNKNGTISCDFDSGKNTGMICMHVQNEIGTIQPIENIKVPFFCDMSQSFGKLPVNVSMISNLKIAVFSAHKFGGPVGIGILYLQDVDMWFPFGSGSRYLLDRPGTPDTGMIVATKAAMENAISTLSSRYQKSLAFRSIIESFMFEKGIEVIGQEASRTPHTTFINVGNAIAPYIMSQLEAENIYVGLGAACNSLTSKTNPIMNALGYGGKASDYIRISQWGDYGEKEGKLFIKAFSKYVSSKNKA
jgi:cysteine desulfurase